MPVVGEGVIGDHLRVCGADERHSLVVEVREGSSPRVRSGHGVDGLEHGVGGIISACAERTIRYPEWIRVRTDHLRVCGADLHHPIDPAGHAGSSPRVRSGRDRIPIILVYIGIISACAERTRRWSSQATVA